MSSGHAHTVGLLPVLGACSISSYRRGLPLLCPSDSIRMAHSRLRTAARDLEALEISGTVVCAALFGAALAMILLARMACKLLISCCLTALPGAGVAPSGWPLPASRDPGDVLPRPNPTPRRLTQPEPDPARTSYPGFGLAGAMVLGY